MASKCNSKSGQAISERGDCRGCRSDCVQGWGGGRGDAAEARLAGSHLGEANWGQQPWGTLPAPAQPAAQRRVLPNHLFGLTHLGWTASPCCSRLGALTFPSCLPVRDAPASPEHWARLGEKVGRMLTQQDSHHRLLGSPGMRVWGQDWGWLVETCRKDRKRGLHTHGTKARKTETGQNKGRK